MILSEDYKSQDTIVFQVFRREIIADDIRKISLSLIITVENRLASLCVMPLLLSLRKGFKLRNTIRQLNLLDQWLNVQTSKITLRRVMRMTSSIY